MTKHWGALCLVCLLLAACEQEMSNQPRFEAYEVAPDWPDNQSARPPIPGTVARGDRLGPEPGQPPMPLTRALLERGQARYEIYCTPCHGYTGHANGMVVQRGFPAPPSFHTDRLRSLPPAHFYAVIRDGMGRMSSYKARVPEADRWAISFYIKALQLSQQAELADLTDSEREALEVEP